MVGHPSSERESVLTTAPYPPQNYALLFNNYNGGGALSIKYFNPNLGPLGNLGQPT
jgi:hypothetical protein